MLDEWLLKDVKAERWYLKLLTHTKSQINELAVKDTFKNNGFKIKLVGIEGHAEHCVATRAEWTALIEDVDCGVVMGQVKHRPQHQRLPLGDLVEALEWLANSGYRHIIIASCPLCFAEKATRVASLYVNVHISFVSDHRKERFDH